MGNRTCTTVDAAVWVVPLCCSRGGCCSNSDSDGAVCPKCIADFTRLACYPYCMGVRQTGSANSMLRLYNATSWLDRVHLFNCYCALHNVNKQEATTTTAI